MNFPLTVFPVEITKRDESSRQVVYDFLRSGAMWAGAAVAIFQISRNGFHFYNATVPGLPISWDVGTVITQYPWRAVCVTPFAIKLALFAITIAFLMRAEMAFNLWFFYHLGKLLLLFAYLRGITDRTLWTGGPVFPYFELQMIGACVLVAIFSLYLGRKHLRLVFLKAFGHAPEVDDTHEAMSYHAAVASTASNAVKT